ncbi:MAG: hypothetical protein A2498_15810 [Lentisphaerae bacterium RIFOXYC12_FULL_60_16]|nr:MAG: hypothetical protein A2498_15810 [Lentisphaerae bacterium RIFOXYC12_FULL_60_16]OGV69399.1 MAG: hypothetical protein A2269_01680 [Lentisphaerae bacterium RIFOXYA12_FULL_60_10]
MGGILTWDSVCGGQLVGLTVKDELSQHSLMRQGSCMPDLQMVIDGNRLALSSCQAELSITDQAPDFCRLTSRATLHSGAVVTLEYEIHEEGAMFCNFAVDTPAGSSFELGECSVRCAVDTRGVRRMRWGHYTRQPKYKRDYSTVHAFAEFRMFRAAAEVAEERELFPYVSLSLGWENTRFFSNHLEFIMEDWTSYNDGPLSLTRSRVATADGDWQARWFFHEGSTVRITGSFRYRNRWGIMYGRARSQAGAQADPAVRNNAMGLRLAHCMYPYARKGDTWPWVSMPIKQVAAQNPQFFKGNPELSRVDEALAIGANYMIIHQFWMRNPGSNNEPVADYVPFDPAWLKSYVGHCHDKGMGVAFYVRGTEMWHAYSSFFEDFLQPDRDGLYADWNSPFCMGYVKCSPLHVSAHNYFHYTKSMRRRVGAGGVLIGHTGNANAIGSACFDVATAGEFSVRHDELLAHPESTAYYAHLACTGGNLISGNLPDRVVFSSQKAMAVCAAFGMMSHPFMEPGVSFEERVAYIRPLWDAMARLPGRITRLHNPAYIPTRAVTTASDHLYPSLWQSDKRQALLLVTNLNENPESGTVELNLNELELGSKPVITPLDVAGTHGEVQVDGSVVRLKAVPSLQFSAFKIG